MATSTNKKKSNRVNTHQHLDYGGDDYERNDPSLLSTEEKFEQIKRNQKKSIIRKYED